jgi:hypothetical protein
VNSRDEDHMAPWRIPNGSFCVGQALPGREAQTAGQRSSPGAEWHLRSLVELRLRHPERPVSSSLVIRRPNAGGCQAIAGRCTVGDAGRTTIPTAGMDFGAVGSACRQKKDHDRAVNENASWRTAILHCYEPVDLAKQSPVDALGFERDGLPKSGWSSRFKANGPCPIAQ